MTTAAHPCPRVEMLDFIPDASQMYRSWPDVQQSLALSKYLTFSKYLMNFYLWPRRNNRD